MERRTFGALAAATAAGLMVLHHVLTWWSFRAVGSGSLLLTWVSPLPYVLFPLLGAVLLLRGHTRPATGVLATSAALTVPPLASSVLLRLTDPPAFLSGAQVLVFLAATGCLVLAAVVSAVEVEIWPRLRPPPPLATVAAAAVLLTWWFTSTGFRLGSEPLTRFGDPIVAGLDLGGMVINVVGTVVIAGLFGLGLAVRGRLGAAVVAVIAGSSWLSSIVTVLDASSRPDVFVTTAGWLAFAGGTVLLLLAGRWWAADDERLEPAATAVEAVAPIR